MSKATKPKHTPLEHFVAFNNRATNQLKQISKMLEVSNMCPDPENVSWGCASQMEYIAAQIKELHELCSRIANPEE